MIKKIQEMMKDEKQGNLEYAKLAQKWKYRNIGIAEMFEKMAMDEREHLANLQIIAEKLRKKII
jgi:rubrerythrin